MILNPNDFKLDEISLLCELRRELTIKRYYKFI